VGLKSRAFLHNASVDEKRGRRHVSGAISRQTCNDASNFLWLRHAPKRNGAIQHLKQFRTVHGRLIDQCRHGAWADAEDENNLVPTGHGKGWKPPPLSSSWISWMRGSCLTGG